MSFSVVSWNVEHFGSTRRGESPAQVQARIHDVFQLLDQPAVRADVFAIYEVNGAQVYAQVAQRFPEYAWTISEGPGSQQILTGSRIPAFVTHRPEFSRGFSGPLRPGLLVTVRDDGRDYPMLFLHLKAADRPVDLGVRVFQHDRARSLRGSLDKAVEDHGRANFIVAGDFNNVGMSLSFCDSDIPLEVERARIKTMYASPADHMRLLPKTATATFWNGPGSSDAPSDLDHVLAASHLTFDPLPGGADVEVKGWPEQETDDEKKQWIAKYSDHAILRFTVTGAT